MRVFIFVALALVSSASAGLSVPAHQAGSIPRLMQGTWADRPESCEEELTNGVKIDRDTISYYEGEDRLKGRPTVRRIEKSNKSGLDLEAQMVFSGEGRRFIGITRVTVFGNEMYLSSGKDADHFSPKNRMIKCKSIRKSY